MKWEKLAVRRIGQMLHNSEFTMVRTDQIDKIVEEFEKGGTDCVALIHPEAPISLEDLAKLSQSKIKLQIMEQAELEEMAAMMGVPLDDKFWDPNNIFLVPYKPEKK